MKRRTLQSLAGGQRTLERLGSVRDGLLVLGAVLYGAGYVAWSLYAWLNGLGPMTGLDAQYFIAGIPVVFVLIVGWQLGSALSRFYGSTWPTWYRSRPARHQKMIMLCVVGLISMYVVYVVYRFVYDSVLSVAWEPTALGSVIGVVGTLVVFLLRFPSGVEHMNVFTARQARVIVYLMVGSFALIGALLYLRFIYPSIPQAIGGAAPRHAILELYKDKLTKDTVLSVIGRAPRPEEQIFTSRPVLVYHATDSSLLISLNAREPSKRWELLEIRKDAIAAVRWIERRDMGRPVNP